MSVPGAATVQTTQVAFPLMFRPGNTENRVVLRLPWVAPGSSRPSAEAPLASLLSGEGLGSRAGDRVGS